MARGTRIVATLPAILVATACAPEAVDRPGTSINNLYTIFSAVAAVIFVVTAGLIAWSIIRYRDRPGDDSEPGQFHSNLRLEILWFAIPQIIVVVLFLLSIGALDEVDRIDPAPEITVEVEAFQWGWRFSYPDQRIVVVSNARQAAQIYLPVNKPIAFEISSRDVIHSFYIPRFLMKRDAIPGRVNRFDVTIDDEGTYDGKCAEFCGLLHEDMNFTIRAVSDEEFRRWVQRNEGTADDNA